MKKLWQRFKKNSFYPYFERAAKTFVMAFMSYMGWRTDLVVTSIDWGMARNSISIAFGAAALSLIWNWLDPNVG